MQLSSKIKKVANILIVLLFVTGICCIQAAKPSSGGAGNTDPTFMSEFNQDIDKNSNHDNDAIDDTDSFEISGPESAWHKKNLEQLPAWRRWCERFLLWCAKVRQER